MNGAYRFSADFIFKNGSQFSEVTYQFPVGILPTPGIVEEAQAETLRELTKAAGGSWRSISREELSQSLSGSPDGSGKVEYDLPIWEPVPAVKLASADEPELPLENPNKKKEK